MNARKRALIQDNELIEEQKSIDKSEEAQDEKPQELADLFKFYQNISKGEKVLVLIGGGTAALTYLYTQEIEPQYTHIIILGDRGYWDTASHRLAQPHHILALPHSPSDEFVNPAEQDEKNKILPHESRSAYVHSHDFQARLAGLEKATLEALNKQGKKVFIARKVRVKKIDRLDLGVFSLEIDQRNLPILANKVIVASGAGPARTLSPDLEDPFSTSVESKSMNAARFSPKVEERILNYTDILTPVVEKARNKIVFVYGGGATAAWAMEVAALIAKPIAWATRRSFDKAINAGPRVNAIISRSRSIQTQGEISTISYQDDPVSGQGKLLIKVTLANSISPPASNYYLVDYLFNCVGQEAYEKGGLTEIISPTIQSELFPYLDRNDVTGTHQSSMLGWSTQGGDFLIIGAAQATYYDRNRQSTTQAPSVSQFLPRSGQVPITIGGVISSVCALTNYMPLSQDPKTGKPILTSLNVHVMNATQLAAYFTAFYPDASASEVNNAVNAFIAERSQTEFGLSAQRLSKFLHTHFGQKEQKSNSEKALEEIIKDQQEDHKAKKITQNRNSFFTSAMTFVLRNENDEQNNTNRESSTVIAIPQQEMR